MDIIQIFLVPTSTAKPPDDDKTSLFCVSDGIPARVKRGEDMSRHTSMHIQGKMNMPVWKSFLDSGSFKGELTKFYNLYLAEHCNECIGRT